MEDSTASRPISAAEARRLKILARSRDRLTQITGQYSSPSPPAADDALDANNVTPVPIPDTSTSAAALSSAPIRQVTTAAQQAPSTHTRTALSADLLATSLNQEPPRQLKSKTPADDTISSHPPSIMPPEPSADTVRAPSLQPDDHPLDTAALEEQQLDLGHAEGLVLAVGASAVTRLLTAISLAALISVQVVAAEQLVMPPLVVLLTTQVAIILGTWLLLGTALQARKATGTAAISGAMLLRWAKAASGFPAMQASLSAVAVALAVLRGLLDDAAVYATALVVGRLVQAAGNS